MLAKPPVLTQRAAAASTRWIWNARWDGDRGRRTVEAARVRATRSLPLPAPCGEVEKAARGEGAAATDEWWEQASPRDAAAATCGVAAAGLDKPRTRSRRARGRRRRVEAPVVRSTIVVAWLGSGGDGMGGAASSRVWKPIRLQVLWQI